VDSVPADGAAIHYAYTANYDGKDNPVIGNPNGDMAARTRVNATTTCQTFSITPSPQYCQRDRRSETIFRGGDQ